MPDQFTASQGREYNSPQAARSAAASASVELLVRAVADPDTQLPGGETVLMTAARTGRVGPVQALLAREAAVNARFQHGASGRARLIETGATPILFTSHTADFALMRLLVELGADPKIPNADNRPPLLAAAGIGIMAPGEEAGTEESIARLPQSATTSRGTDN